MKRLTLSRRAGSLVYGIGAACAIAGAVLNFSGSLGLGTGLIGAGISLVISTALELGHLKKW
ncbi:MAG: hypothetical protein AB9869_24530 [Verrucomicrobiia bacterium]